MKIPAPGLRPLPLGLLEAGALPAARALLGAWLLARTPLGPLGGPIVEVEAYLPHGDPGSHSRSGPTRRNRAMFGPPGRAYVYRIYGLHHCFNVVAGPVGSGEAVLIRALAPCLWAGRDPDPRLARGPGRLAALLGIDLTLDGSPLVGGRGPLELWRDPRLPISRSGIAQARRVGLGAGRGQELALRLAQLHHPQVSAPLPFARRPALLPAALGAANARARRKGQTPVARSPR